MVCGGPVKAIGLGPTGGLGYTHFSDSLAGLEVRMPGMALFFMSLLLAEATAERQLSADITQAELKAHVCQLASADCQGRKGAGGARTSRHLAELFEQIGLQPGAGKSYFQPIPWLLAKPGEESFVGR